jgi:hypothetical protein
MFFLSLQSPLVKVAKLIYIVPSIAVEWLSLRIHTLEVSISNFGTVSGYPYFVVVFLSPSRQILQQYPQIKPQSLHSTYFSFIWRNKRSSRTASFFPSFRFPVDHNFGNSNGFILSTSPYQMSCFRIRFIYYRQRNKQLVITVLQRHVSTHTSLCHPISYLARPFFL